MFEIGNSLRETRRRQGLALDDVAQATLIRNRYLDALEHERFELLPEGFYRRSFLRRYADFLGLDGDLYVDEYELRYRPAEVETEVEQRRYIGSPQLPARRPTRRLVLAGTVALAALIALAGFEFVGAPDKGHTPAAQGDSVTHLSAAAVPLLVTGSALEPAPRVLVLTATRGDCWIEVRVGSLNGAAIFTGTLARGGSARFGLGQPLWINLGAPDNLDATLQGRDVTAQLPASPSEVVASTHGIHTAS